MVQPHDGKATPPRAGRTLAVLLACAVPVMGCATRTNNPQTGPATGTPTVTAAPSGSPPAGTTGPPVDATTGPATGSTRTPVPGGTVTARPAPSLPAGYPSDARTYAEDALLAWTHGAADRLVQLTTPAARSALTGRTDLRDRDWAYLRMEGAAGSTYVTFDAGGAQLVIRVANQLLGKPQAIDEVRF